MGLTLDNPYRSSLTPLQNYYAPQIFKGLGMSGTSVRLFATGVYGIVKVVGCFVFLVFAADSLGRRWSLLWTSAAQAISMYIVGAYGKTDPPQEGKPVCSARKPPVLAPLNIPNV